MTDTTALGIPYPEVTDRVADGWDAIRDLAEAVDALIAAGTAARNAAVATLNAADAALDARLDALEAAPGWVAPTLAAGWANYGAGWATAGYRKIRGVTYLRGLVKRTANPTSDTIFTLPAGYRPGMSGLYLATVLGLYGVPGNYSGEPFDNVSTDISNIGVRLDISSGGGVTLSNSYAEQMPPGAGDVGYVSLNGISFLAEA